MDAYLGEVRSFAFTFNPANWMDCNGALLPIAEYTPLFSLLGTLYGGDGRTTFALPKMQPIETSGTNGMAWRICVANAPYPQQD